MEHRGSRRAFLKTGAAAMGASWPMRHAWSVEGADRGALKILFYTDVHTRTEYDTPVALARAAESMNAQKADLIIAGGDLITDGFQAAQGGVEDRWDAYVKMHRALRGEVHPAIGNHDLVAARPEDGSAPAADPRAAFRDKLGVPRTYRSFDALGVHFIFLDAIHLTDDELKFHGVVNEEQLAWLDEDLAALPEATPIILVTHIPLLTVFYQATRGTVEAPPANRVVVNNREVLQRFEGRNLMLVLQGHLHVNEWHRWRGATFVTGGAVCGKWWRGPWQGTEEGFGTLTLHPDRVDWSYLDYGWTARRP